MCFRFQYLADITVFPLLLHEMKYIFLTDFYLAKFSDQLLFSSYFLFCALDMDTFSTSLPSEILPLLGFCDTTLLFSLLQWFLICSFLWWLTILKKWHLQMLACLYYIWGNSGHYSSNVLCATFFLFFLLLELQLHLC